VHSDAIDVDSWPQPTIVMAKKNLRTMQINVLTCCKIEHTHTQHKKVMELDALTNRYTGSLSIVPFLKSCQHCQLSCTYQSLFFCVYC